MATRLAKAAVDAGVDGVLLVDLPPEEAGDAQQAFDAAGLALVLLASPTTSEARADKLLALARGYLYYVSFAGVTGASERLDSDAAGTRLQALRARASVPVVAGFGIRMPPVPRPWPARPMAWWSEARWWRRWRKRARRKTRCSAPGLPRPAAAGAGRVTGPAAGRRPPDGWRAKAAGRRRAPSST